MISRINNLNFGKIVQTNRKTKDDNNEPHWIQTTVIDNSFIDNNTTYQNIQIWQENKSLSDKNMLDIQA